jgi:hypothetical protein
MSRSPELELQHLKTAINFLVGFLEDGSLVPHYDVETRRELGEALNHMLHKLEGLPEEVPDRLVQAVVVRAISEASEHHNQVEKMEKSQKLELNMREAEVSASLHGHDLGQWVQVSGSDMEFQATCQGCGGFVYVSYNSTYNLLLDSCERIHLPNE